MELVNIGWKISKMNRINSFAVFIFPKYSSFFM